MAMTDAAEAIDGTAVDEPSGPTPEPPITTSVVVHNAPVSLAPTATAADLVERLTVIKDAMETAMVEGVDYGRIPGAKKPSLFKPGAEKLGTLFRLDVQPQITSTWGPGDHLTVECTTTVFDQETGARLGKGVGLCTSREKKYAKRTDHRTCPNCGQPAIIKGKKEYGGGWVCFKKKDGCGSKWNDGDPVIEDQPVGEIDNPDLPDTWNTIVKMAKKRAHVDAMLAVTGASAIFTQDIEDNDPGAGGPVTASVTELPAYAVEGDTEVKLAAFQAITAICGGDAKLAKECGARIKAELGGVMPVAACAALTLVGQYHAAAGDDVPFSEGAA